MNIASLVLKTARASPLTCSAEIILFGFVLTKAHGDGQLVRAVRVFFQLSPSSSAAAAKEGGRRGSAPADPPFRNPACLPVATFNPRRTQACSAPGPRPR